MAADVKEMYHQFERTVFGEMSAPSRANYTMRRNADENGEDLPLGVKAVYKCFYMEDEQRGILLRMRQENLFGAFGAILIFSACFCGFSTERSTPFCDIFWRGMEEYDKFTTISNSVDTCGVCWLFG